MGETVIKVENLSKRYRLGTIGSGTLTQDLNRWWAKVRGKEDPYSIIGQHDTQETLNQDFWALEEINFKIKKGEAIGIIGKNGAGKSTLLKILSRVTAPTSGKIHIKGRIASLLEVGTGFHPELTGRENIFLNGAILGMTKQEIKAKLDEIVHFSGVGNYIDTPVKRYSSGMYVRLAFAVAAHLDSEILVLDEVLAVGDVEFQKKCLGKMNEVSTKEGRTVIFVSHDMQAITTLTRKTLFLKKGKLFFEGSTDDAITHYINANKTDAIEYLDNFPSDKPIISNVKLITTFPGNVQRNGEPMVVEITIKTPISIKGACLSFQMVDAKERSYAHLWTFDSDQPMCREPGEHLIRCVISNLRLYMGKYYLKVFFTEPPGGQVFQVLENVCPFEVVMYGHHREFQWQPNAAAYIEKGAWEIYNNTENLHHDTLIQKINPSASQNQ